MFNWYNCDKPILHSSVFNRMNFSYIINLLNLSYRVWHPITDEIFMMGCRQTNRVEIKFSPKSHNFRIMRNGNRKKREITITYKVVSSYVPSYDSSVESVRSWCDGSSDRSFMGRTHWAISHSSQCSTTGVTKAVVCAILSVGWCI